MRIVATTARAHDEEQPRETAHFYQTLATSISEDKFQAPPIGWVSERAVDRDAAESRRRPAPRSTQTVSAVADDSATSALRRTVVLSAETAAAAAVSDDRRAYLASSMRRVSSR